MTAKALAIAAYKSKGTMMQTNQMKEPKNLKEAWADYRANLYPSGITGTQEVECSQAFYAGALIMLHLMSGITEQPLAEDEQARKLEELRQEGIGFIRQQTARVLEERARKN